MNRPDIAAAALFGAALMCSLLVGLFYFLARGVAKSYAADMHAMTLGFVVIGGMFFALGSAVLVVTR